MNSIDFCYWLQGYFEISGTTELTKEQSAIVQNHLNLVFVHEIDNLYDNGDKDTKQNYHNIHQGKNDELMRC